MLSDHHHQYLGRSGDVGRPVVARRDADESAIGDDRDDCHKLEHVVPHPYSTALQSDRPTPAIPVGDIFGVATAAADVVSKALVRVAGVA